MMKNDTARAQSTKGMRFVDEQGRTFFLSRGFSVVRNGKVLDMHHEGVPNVWRAKSTAHVVATTVDFENGDFNWVSFAE